jgi:hypothetical protein
MPSRTTSDIARECRVPKPSAVAQTPPGWDRCFPNPVDVGAAEADEALLHSREGKLETPMQSRASIPDLAREYEVWHPHSDTPLGRRPRALRCRSTAWGFTLQKQRHRTEKLTSR